MSRLSWFTQQFSDQEAVQILRDARWWPDRNVPIDDVIVTLEKKGYPVFQQAKAFLRQFVGIEVKLPGEKWDYEVFRITPGIWNDYNEGPMLAYREFVNAPLCAVGRASNGHALLMIDPNGYLYGGFDEYFWLLSTDGLDALISLITSKEPVWKTELPEYDG